MNHVYHYHAFRQPSYQCERTHMDGVVILQHRITGVDDFKLVKKAVADHNGVPVEGLVLANLSYLGEAKPASTQETSVTPTNPNTGHGHVWERPDGMKARCGGPGMCAECSRDEARLIEANARAKTNR